MKYILLLLLLTLLSFSASADMCNDPASKKVIDYAWTAANEREVSNKPLAPDEIAGYKLYVGDATGAYSCSITINDGTATSYSLKVLGNLDYYAVVTTIDTDGRESQYSSEVFIPADEEPEPPEVIEPPKQPRNFVGTKKELPVSTGGAGGSF